MTQLTEATTDETAAEIPSEVDDVFHRHGYRVLHREGVEAEEEDRKEYSGEVEAVEFPVRMVEYTVSRPPKPSFLAQCPLLHWRWLRHPNILRLVEYFVEEQRIYFVYEDVEDSNAISTIGEYDFDCPPGSSLRERLCRKWTKQCLKALLYMNELCLYHNNFGFYNSVLLDRKLNVKLYDFEHLVYVPPSSFGATVKPPSKSTSSSVHFEVRPLSTRGRKAAEEHGPPCRSPEALGSKRMTRSRAEKAEVWSLGASLMAVLLEKNISEENYSEMASDPPTGRNLGEGGGGGDKSTIQKNVTGLKDLLVQQGNLTEDCQDFLLKCLNFLPTNRPTIQELLQHPWLTRESEEEEEEEEKEEAPPYYASFPLPVTDIYSPADVISSTSDLEQGAKDKAETRLRKTVEEEAEKSDEHDARRTPVSVTSLEDTKEVQPKPGDKEPLTSYHSVPPTSLPTVTEKTEVVSGSTKQEVSPEIKPEVEEDSEGKRPLTTGPPTQQAPADGTCFADSDEKAVGAGLPGDKAKGASLLGEGKGVEASLPEEKAKTSGMPVGKALGAGLPVEKVEGAGLSGEKLAEGSLPEEKAKTSGMPVEKAVGAGLPGDKAKGASLPEEKVAEASLPKEKVKTSGIAEEKAVGAGLPKKELAEGSLSEEKLAKNGLPAEKAKSAILPEETPVDASLPEGKLKTEVITEQVVKPKPAETGAQFGKAMPTMLRPDGQAAAEALAKTIPMSREVAIGLEEDEEGPSEYLEEYIAVRRVVRKDGPKSSRPLKAVEAEKQKPEVALEIPEKRQSDAQKIVTEVEMFSKFVKGTDEPSEESKPEKADLHDIPEKTGEALEFEYPAESDELVEAATFPEEEEEEIEPEVKFPAVTETTTRAQTDDSTESESTPYPDQALESSFPKTTIPEPEVPEKTKEMKPDFPNVGTKDDTESDSSGVSESTMESGFPEETKSVEPSFPVKVQEAETLGVPKVESEDDTESDSSGTSEGTLGPTFPEETKSVKLSFPEKTPEAEPYLPEVESGEDTESDSSEDKLNPGFPEKTKFENPNFPVKTALPEESEESTESDSSADTESTVKSRNFPEEPSFLEKPQEAEEPDFPEFDYEDDTETDSSTEDTETDSSEDTKSTLKPGFPEESKHVEPGFPVDTPEVEKPYFPDDKSEDDTESDSYEEIDFPEKTKHIKPAFPDDNPEPGSHFPDAETDDSTESDSFEEIGPEPDSMEDIKQITKPYFPKKTKPYLPEQTKQPKPYFPKQTKQAKPYFPKRTKQTEPAFPKKIEPPEPDFPDAETEDSESESSVETELEMQPDFPEVSPEDAHSDSPEVTTPPKLKTDLPSEESLSLESDSTESYSGEETNELLEGAYLTEVDTEDDAESDVSAKRKGAVKKPAPKGVKNSMKDMEQQLQSSSSSSSGSSSSSALVLHGPRSSDESVSSGEWAGTASTSSSMEDTMIILFHRTAKHTGTTSTCSVCQCPSLQEVDEDGLEAMDNSGRHHRMASRASSYEDTIEILTWDMRWLQ